MRNYTVVVGLGYVGLPLVQEAVRAGIETIGLDRDSSIVDSLNQGRSHVDDISDDDVRELLDLKFRATTDESVIKSAQSIIVCVPTPLSDDGGPDLRAVLSASRSIATNLSKDALVVLESTTYPGTTEEVVKPILEESGLRAGADFNLAFSPERIDPGNSSFGLSNTPKVVGGFTQECTASAARFYSQFVETVVEVSGTREAEMSKLIENTYRHINIALVNEMAIFCNELGIDIWEAIRAASSKPFGFQAFYPGPGVGGHCIPIDPNYLSFNVRSRLGYPFRFVELAEEINHRMPSYIAARAQDMLNLRSLPVRGSVVLLLGLTYKADIADERESPSRHVAERLMEKGAILKVHDPLLTAWGSVPEAEFVNDPYRAASTADLVILLQAHSSYDVGALVEAAVELFDTRGVVSPASNVVKL